MRYISISLLLSFLPIAATLAQQPKAGFSTKQKTNQPTPDLAKRLGAGLTPVPYNRAATTTLADNVPIQGLVSGSLRVVRDPETGLPIAIERNLPVRNTTSQTTRNGAGRLAAQATAYRFLDEVKTVLNVQSPAETFAIGRTETDDLGQVHIRLTQTYAGLPVHGAELIAHLTDGDVTHLNGRYHALPEGLKTRPELTPGQAVQYALADVRQETTVRTFGDNIFHTKQVEENTLCIFQTEAGPKLAYRLLIWPDLHKSWSYMIDARTGAVLQKYSRACLIDGPQKATARDLNGVTRTFSTYLSGTVYTTIDAGRTMFDKKSQIPDNPLGCIWTLDQSNTIGDKKTFNYPRSANNTDWNPTLVSAHYNSGIVYDYFLNTHKRNSIDGNGGSIISLINVADEKTGKGFDNAYWNGKAMFYGNGDVAFKPLAGGLDVAAHEMTHGVVQNTANLEYKAQSGAINESMADIFGCMVDRNNWQIGESIVVAKYFSTGALRDLSNPNQGGKGTNGYQPKTMSQYEKTDSDNGGVHINSGIPNYAFYLIATDVTKDKAEKIYYRALANYLTATAQFLDLRLAVIKAAGDLYGATSAEVASAKKAFDMVGILDATQTPAKTDIPVAQGPDLVLVAASSDKRLYSTATAVTPVKFDVKTTTGVVQRASITDDGKNAYYVSADKRIRSVNLTGTPAEFVVQNETLWRNVAISRDGTKLAALTDAKDGSIWVYSFTLKKWNQFKLYTPTFTQDTQSDNAQYADSFEWDPAGDNLIFDEFNAQKSATGTDISYWDVGIMRVWNGSTGQFGDGSIRKLFSSLPDGVSIGNPSYAKNSLNILTFDYYNADDDTYAVLAYDISQKSLKKVYDNNTLGFPNYSRTDDRIVFSTLTGTREDIGSIPVGADKVTVAGAITRPYLNAKWPVWYTQATRQQVVKANQTISFAALTDRYTDAAPQTLVATSSVGLPVSFAVVSGPAQITGNQLTVTGPGKVTIRAYQDGNADTYAATAVDQSFTAQVVLGVEPLWSEALKLYPNPTSRTLTVEIPAGIVIEQLQLTTLNSTVIPVVAPARARQATLDLSTLPKGLYLLQIDTDKGTTHRKVLKE